MFDMCISQLKMYVIFTIYFNEMLVQQN